MYSSLPEDALLFLDWTWAQIEPFFQSLLARSLDEKSISDWLTDWSELSKLLDEAYWRHYDATAIDTSDQEVDRKFKYFLDEIRPRAKAAEQKLKEKLLASELTPQGYEVPLRDLRTQADLFREENLPLLSEEKKLAVTYDKLIGDQTVIWEGEELTLPQLQPVYQETDRVLREKAWRLAAERQLADRQTINALWSEFLDLRRRIADNADLPDYRAYRWRELLRFAYTPQDCFQFHQAIEEVIVPAAKSVYEKRGQRLGLSPLRPWDLEVDPYGEPPLKPFTTSDELESKTSNIFHQVDPQLGAYFESMRREDLLDLENRKNKAPGGFCSHYQHTERPFIFMNAVGIHDDVQTLLHEGGHAFHVFESGHLPFFFLEPPLEFAEVASTSIELLAGPYLTSDHGGFYTDEQAARARIQLLESLLLFWPYMTVVDAFQHWVYENRQVAMDADNCDARWAQLWDRFMPDVDWSGLEDEMMTGWQRKIHIFSDPFYYVDYGLAQLGAIQVWQNAIRHQAQAVRAYRKALSLGRSVTLPQLFSTAGAKFAFDIGTLQRAAELIQKTVSEQEELIG
jgi:oligoendopeptidase F